MSAAARSVDLPTYMSPPETAKILRVDPATVIGWIKSGELRASDLASRSAKRPRYRISRAALEAFLASREPHRPKPKRSRQSSRPMVTEYF